VSFRGFRAFRGNTRGANGSTDSDSSESLLAADFRVDASGYFVADTLVVRVSTIKKLLRHAASVEKIVIAAV
jgi:hypothetical protein